MRILLLSMPDTADVIDYFFRAPNLALVSLAGNLPNHETKVLDLVLCKPRIRETLGKILEDFRPHLVGLSAMTFQFDTLLRVARFIRSRNSAVLLAAGGYHATLMAREITEADARLPLDFLIRGEGEETFKELVDSLVDPNTDRGDIQGLSYRNGAQWQHNPDRPLLHLDLLPLPRRESRLFSRFSFLGSPVDVAETSRGCPYSCKFCSITQMYGRVFRPFPMQRIVKDLSAIRAQGYKGVFLADDNISYRSDHLRQVCQTIVDHGLNDLFYIAQVSASGIARHPEVASDMARANFRVIFVGFESMDPVALKGMRKPASPQINREAAMLLHGQGIAIVAGCIVGYPEDTRATVAHQYALIKQLRPDMIYAQYMTPYPKTVIREEMLKEGLIVNKNDHSLYDGFTCNTRTRHLTQNALYRILKKEAVKAYLTPSLLINNRLLAMFKGHLVKAAIKAFWTNAYNVLLARQRSDELGI